MNLIARGDKWRRLTSDTNLPLSFSLPLLFRCDSRTNSGTTSDRHRCCRLTMPNQPATTCFNHCCDERRVPPMHDESHPSSQNNNSSHRFRDHTHRPPTPINPPATTPVRPQRRRSQVETDLETLDREINALDAAMPPIDPEITQGAEQLEKAVVSRKRTRMEACLETDRFLALSQFYFPSPRLLSGIDDPPGMDGLIKRQRLVGPSFDSALVDFDLNLDHHHQREFEVIMETLRFGPTIAGGNTGLQACNATTAPASDSCGHAAMLSEQCNGGGFHSLVVASLET